ncbi:MAG TPA: hypothetical protein DDW72_26295, partial [Afipia sp.]|nr:hypothetical protein [Afipia sp.]
MVSAVRTTGRPSERISYPLEAVDYRLAETQAEKEQIYRLRYRAYLREGAIVPNARQMVQDQYDDLPNSWNFGVYRDGVLMSSLRITVSSPETPACPSLGVFPDLLEPEIAKGRVLIDPTRFVADPDREAPSP